MSFDIRRTKAETIKPTPKFLKVSPQNLSISFMPPKGKEIFGKYNYRFILNTYDNNRNKYFKG